MLALYIAKAGYYSGSLDNIMKARVDYVIQTFFYEIFTNDYETAFIELNNKKDK